MEAKEKVVRQFFICLFLYFEASIFQTSERDKRLRDLFYVLESFVGWVHVSMFYEFWF